MKKDFKLWLNVFTFVALALLVVLAWDQVKEAFVSLATLNTWVLVFIVPMQVIGYYALARFYKEFFVTQGQDIRLRDMAKVVMELNFVNHVFPSGGVSGFSYLGIRMRSLGVPVAKSTLAQILRFALTFLSFIVLLLFGLLAFALGSGSSPFVVLVSSMIIFSTIAGAMVGAYIISKTSRIRAFVTWLPKALNAVSRLIRSRRRDLISMDRVEDVLEDLHKDYIKVRKNMSLVKKLFVWALLVNITEIMSIYLVYIAFGEWINPGALILAYAVANFAGLVAILPGGVGIYEGMMTAVMTGAGVGKALALSATIVFRVLSMLLGLPIGYYLYSRALSKGSERKRTKKD